MNKMTNNTNKTTEPESKWWSTAIVLGVLLLTLTACGSAAVEAADNTDQAAEEQEAECRRWCLPMSTVW